MQHFKTTYKYKKWLYSFLLPLLANVICLFFYYKVKSQTCPPNIDFETGTFTNWSCMTGFTSANDTQNVIILTGTNEPVYNHHTMFSANTKEVDPYGGFPVICPNGSGYSIRLGSNEAGGEAEGIAYQFMIPPNENSYSVTYHYAVVFQSPNHKHSEQPRMEVTVTNLTDNIKLNCGSLSFIAGPALQGFETSNRSDTTPVYYKNWSAVTVDLSGNAGKTIKLFFKTADCTFTEHFGYAYIDVGSECSEGFIGATYCPDDTIVHVTAPYGYHDYTWYDNSLINILGKQQTLSLSPPPVPGTTVAVKLNPFDGYGCPITVYTTLKNSLVVKANAGRDTLSCTLKPVPIGTNSKPGLVYKWSPATGLSNSQIANPFAAPDTTTTYIVTTSSRGGGCTSKDTVVVRSFQIDTIVQLIGKPAFCFDYGDSAILKIHSAKNIQWYKNDVPINGATDTIYRVNTSGTYYALLENDSGCSITTQKYTIAIDTAKPGISYPTRYAIINSPLALEARTIGDNISWKPATNLNIPTSFTPVFIGISEQLYLIAIRTNTGCLTVDTQLVKTFKSIEIHVPNAFTPGNDGLNDYLRPILRGVQEFSYFRIFNRSGRIIFESKFEKPGWDGTFNGMPQQTQVIVWMLKFVGVDGEEYSKKGTSVLLR